MTLRGFVLGGIAASAALGANAQSSVTVYGMLDVAPAVFSRTTTADDRMFKLNSDTGSSSRFGVRGTEDLGGGLSAIFNLESPLDPKSGTVGGGAASGACNVAAGCAGATTAAFWRRNAYVGLRSKDWGEVTLGRNYTAGIIRQADTYSAAPSGINSGLATTLAAQGLSNDFWNSNQVRYDSPKFGPVDFALNVSAGEGATGRNVGGNVRFVEGPVVVSVSYQQDKNLAGAAVKYWIVAGTYDFGPIKLYLGGNKVDNSEGVLGFVDSSVGMGGVRYNATPQLTVSAQYFAVKENVGNSTTSKVLVLNADYALSKRTYLYALFGQADNKDLGIVPLWSNLNNATFTVPNEKVSALAVGIRHVF